MKIYTLFLLQVGGKSREGFLKSVERYCPRTNTWTTVADLNVSRSHAKIVVLNGVLYAIGGFSERYISKCIESYNPTSNTWTIKSDMRKIDFISGN